MARDPRPGTRDFVVREVANREGWSEAKARAIVKDGVANGKDIESKQRRLMKDDAERDRG